MPGILFPATYIIRLYRSEANDPRRLVGTVEEVGGQMKKPFAGLFKLWEILKSHQESEVRKREEVPRKKRRKKK